MNSNVILGQIAYEAYCEQTGWKSAISGAALPQWDNVKPEIKVAWGAAGSAVATHINNLLVKNLTIGLVGDE